MKMVHLGVPECMGPDRSVAGDMVKKLRRQSFHMKKKESPKNLNLNTNYRLYVIVTYRGVASLHRRNPPACTLDVMSNIQKRNPSPSRPANGDTTRSSGRVGRLRPAASLKGVSPSPSTAAGVNDPQDWNLSHENQAWASNMFYKRGNWSALVHPVNLADHFLMCLVPIEILGSNYENRVYWEDVFKSYNGATQKRQSSKAAMSPYYKASEASHRGHSSTTIPRACI
ncbi:hypothetical protein BJ138DRAFT_1182706 [Hygrophoropsis aurantiaca]|uniref:Uncharacterized protein n=1 Tax=Hygrophoropsis aurantiaca TaxID=72124 RepID=A0ACB8A217_9AGAM|nr:hypothetical protein BJ138DRAFT_1182706 [Hygrophoropsis aurantiaca]